MAGNEIEVARLPREWATPGMTLAQLVAIVAAHRRLILLIGLGAMVFAGVVSVLMSKTYLASATLRIDPPARDAESNTEISPMLAASYTATQMDLIRSDRVLGTAVSRLGWDQDSEHTRKGESPEQTRQRLAERVLSPNLKLTGGAKDSRFLQLDYASRDPDEAARIANIIAETYIATLNGSVADPIDQRSRTYAAQLEALRRAVDDAQAKVTAFRNENGLIDLDRTVDAEGKYLLDLNTRLVDAEASERQGQLRLSGARRGAASDVSVLDSPVIQALKERLLQLETRESELAHTLGPNHPDYRAVRGEIEVARSRLAAETGTYFQALRQQAGISSGDAAQLRKEIAAQRTKVLQVRGKQEEGASLQRALDAAKTVYDKALQNYDQVMLSGTRRLPTVSIFSEAIPPLLASRPVIRTNVMLGLIGGLVCGLLGCVLWELLHRRVRCRDDVERDLGQFVLAELPGNALPPPRRALLAVRPS